MTTEHSNISYKLQRIRCYYQLNWYMSGAWDDQSMSINQVKKMIDVKNVFQKGYLFLKTSVFFIIPKFIYIYIYNMISWLIGRYPL